MGRNTKKLSKVADKNGKRKQFESALEKNQEKVCRKSKSFWSRWSSIFNRINRRTRSQTTTSIAPILVTPQMRDAPQDMELWNDEENLDINSHMINIPIEPGRQVSTIILSPTKTGFKAVIAHYDVNSTIKRKLTKDLAAVPTIGNRRTLTLVFDMNQRTFREVSKTEGILDNERVPGAEMTRSLSTSAIYMRNESDDNLVESAAFLQAQLSLEETPITRSSLIISETQSFNFGQRQLSCRSMGRARVAFKTISEPIWKEKDKLRKELLIKENVQEILNEFIFLDRDDSFTSKDNMGEKKSFPMVYEKPEDDFSNNLSIGNLEDSTPSSSTRNVASDLLVNIKPFKQYIGSYQKSFLEKPQQVQLKPPSPLPRELQTKSYGPLYNSYQLEVRKRAIETPVLKPDTFKVKNSVIKSKLSLCIKCGSELNRNESANSNSFREQDRRAKSLQQATKATKEQGYAPEKYRSNVTFLSTTNKELPCTLCSVWKLYKKKSSHSGKYCSIAESFDNIIKELCELDDGCFRRNISQFRTKIVKENQAQPLEVKSTTSSLSFSEVSELPQLSYTCIARKMRTVESSHEEERPRITVNVIEVVRQEDKPQMKTTFEESSLLHLYQERAKIRLLENSWVLFAFEEANMRTKVMAQMIEEEMVKSFLETGEVEISQSTITVLYSNVTSCSKDPMDTPSVETNNSDETRKNFIMVKRTVQIPDVIGQLLTTKVEDLRNELITRMNETRLTYNLDEVVQTQDPYEEPEVLGSIDYFEDRKYLNQDGGDVSEVELTGMYGSESGLLNEEVAGTEMTVVDEEDSLVRVTSSNRKAFDVVELDANVEELEMFDDEEYLETFEEYCAMDEVDVTAKVIVTSLEDLVLPCYMIAYELEDPEIVENAVITMEEDEEEPEQQCREVTTYISRADFRILSSLSFFIPTIEQIQTAIQILNMVAYDFLIRKEQQTQKESLRMMRSYTILTDKKRSVPADRGVESVITKKCVEKNIVNGIETTKTSKKEITTIESSKSGNHLLVTNKRILTKNDRIKKAELVGGVNDSELRYPGGRKENLVNNSEESVENMNGIRFLYYKKNEDPETCDSSLTSETSYVRGKIGASSSSEMGDEIGGSTDTTNPTKHRIGGSEGNAEEMRSCEHSKEDDSLQEAEVASSRDPIKVELVTLMQRGKGSIIKSSDKASAGKRDSNISAWSSRESIQIPLKELVKATLTKDNVIINDEAVSSIILPQTLRTPSIKVIKKIGKGIVSKRISPGEEQSGSGRELVVRGREPDPEGKRDAGPGKSKKMSVVIMLSKSKPDKGKLADSRNHVDAGGRITATMHPKAMFKLSDMKSVGNNAQISLKRKSVD